MYLYFFSSLKDLEDEADFDRVEEEEYEEYDAGTGDESDLENFVETITKEDCVVQRGK